MDEIEIFHILFLVLVRAWAVLCFFACKIDTLHLMKRCDEHEHCAATEQSQTKNNLCRTETQFLAHSSSFSSFFRCCFDVECFMCRSFFIISARNFVYLKDECEIHFV